MSPETDAPHVVHQGGEGKEGRRRVNRKRGQWRNGTVMPPPQPAEEEADAEEATEPPISDTGLPPDGTTAVMGVRMVHTENVLHEPFKVNEEVKVIYNSYTLEPKRQVAYPWEGILLMCI